MKPTKPGIYESSCHEFKGLRNVFFYIDEMKYSYSGVFLYILIQIESSIFGNTAKIMIKQDSLIRSFILLMSPACQKIQFTPQYLIKSS